MPRSRGNFPLTITMLRAMHHCSEPTANVPVKHGAVLEGRYDICSSVMSQWVFWLDCWYGLPKAQQAELLTPSESNGLTRPCRNCAGDQVYKSVTSDSAKMVQLCAFPNNVVDMLAPFFSERYDMPVYQWTATPPVAASSGG